MAQPPLSNQVVAPLNAGDVAATHARRQALAQLVQPMVAAPLNLADMVVAPLNLADMAAVHSGLRRLTRPLAQPLAPPLTRPLAPPLAPPKPAAQLPASVLAQLLPRNQAIVVAPLNPEDVMAVHDRRLALRETLQTQQPPPPNIAVVPPRAPDPPNAILAAAALPKPAAVPINALPKPAAAPINAPPKPAAAPIDALPKPAAAPVNALPPRQENQVVFADNVADFATVHGWVQALRAQLQAGLVQNDENDDNNEMENQEQEQEPEPFVFVPAPPPEERGDGLAMTFLTENMIAVNSLFAWVTSLVHWNTEVFSAFRDNLILFTTNERNRYQLEAADVFNQWTNGGGIDVVNGHLDFRNTPPVEIRRAVDWNVRYQWLRNAILDRGWRTDVFAPIHRYMDKWGAAAASVLPKIRENGFTTIPQLVELLSRNTTQALYQLRNDFNQTVTQAFAKTDRELTKLWDEVQGRMMRTLLAEAKMLEDERDADLPLQGNVGGLSYRDHVRTMYGRLMIAVVRTYEAVAEKPFPDSVAAIAERETRRVKKEEDAKQYAEQMRLVVRFKERVYRLLVQKQAIDPEVQRAENDGDAPVPMIIDQLDEEAAQVQEDVPMQILGLMDPTKMSADELNRVADFLEELYRKYAMLKQVNTKLLDKYKDARVASFVRRFMSSRREIHQPNAKNDLRQLEKLLAESTGVTTAQYQPFANLALEIDEETRLSLWPIERVTAAARVPRAYGPLYHFAQQMAGAANTSLDLILTRIFPDIASGSTLWHMVMGRVEDEFTFHAGNDDVVRNQRFERHMNERFAKLRDLQTRAAENPMDAQLQYELGLERDKMQREAELEHDRMVMFPDGPVRTHARHSRSELNNQTVEDVIGDLDALEQKLMSLMATPDKKEEMQKELHQKRLLQIRVGVDALRRLNQCHSLDELLSYLPEFYVPTASYAVRQMHEFVKSDPRWRKVPLYELMFADVVSLRFAALCGTHMLLYSMENSSEKLDLNRYELARKNHETNSFQFLGNSLHRKASFKWEVVYPSSSSSSSLFTNRR